jgi:hypothetical protein
VHRTNFLLHCSKVPDNLITDNQCAKDFWAQPQERWGMGAVWETKDGRRRVRRDPPTVEEAVLAAQGLTDELGAQVEIVASLMDVPVDEARGAVLRMGSQRKDVNRVTIAGRGGASRAVVVERRTVRRPLTRSPSMGFAR